MNGILVLNIAERMIDMSHTLYSSTSLDLLNLDATAIANMIRTQQVSVEKVVTTYVNHIQDINKSLNAIIEERFDEALTEAKVMDEHLQVHVHDKPLYGVPISVKESFNVKGMTTTGGLTHRQDLISKNDAYVVDKLKEAGAIILGKTNTPALCFCQETHNKLYGRTNNPWDLNRTPGGSSGGEGALLGAGGAAVGIGSDIGGSIRVPSHFNGIIGFKPGKFQVSNNGHFPPISHPLQQRMECMGPMGKSVRDMRLLYNIIAQNKPSHQTLDNTSINILSSNNNPYPLSEATKDVLHSIEAFLSKHFSTEQIIPPYFEESAQLWQEIMSINGSKDIEKLAFNNDRSRLIYTFIKEKVTEQTDVHPYLSWALIGSKLFKPSNKRVKDIENFITQGDHDLNEYLKNRLLLFPVYHTSAQPHGQVYKEIFSIRKTFKKYMPYIAYANVWGLPSLIVPVGLDHDNLPLGIQIMSINGNEDKIFQIGELLEEEFRGYVRCKNLDK